MIKVSYLPILASVAKQSNSEALKMFFIYLLCNSIRCFSDQAFRKEIQSAGTLIICQYTSQSINMKVNLSPPPKIA